MRVLWLIPFDPRLWREIKAGVRTPPAARRLGQDGPRPLARPFLPARRTVRGTRVAYSAAARGVAEAAAVETSTVTPGPMVELSEIFFR